jgi:peptidase M42 family hydrolase
VHVKKLSIDMDYVRATLLRQLSIPSPTGYTDEIVHWMGEELERLQIPFELTRRGAIRANLAGEQQTPDRAIVAHVDTLGAMIKRLKDNGRCEIVPIGTWSPRFAEGGRVTIYCDRKRLRGTVLPAKASGHVFNEEVDTQPVTWENLELRVDVLAESAADLERAGLQCGDFIAFDPQTEITESGFVVSRYLDDKAGTTALLAAAKAVTEELRSSTATNCSIPVDCHLLFTITEEVGSGASAALHGDVAELVSIDNATPAPGQNSKETGVTIAMMDQSGPFDYHLTHKLLQLCRDHGIDHQRDIFKFYRTDAAAAVEAGNDLRTALVCFGADASHGYERTHLTSVQAVAELLALYIQSAPTFMRDRAALAPLAGFPHQGPAAEKSL